MSTLKKLSASPVGHPGDGTYAEVVELGHSIGGLGSPIVVGTKFYVQLGSTLPNLWQKVEDPVEFGDHPRRESWHLLQ